MSDMNPFGRLPHLLADVKVYVDLMAKSKAVPTRPDAKLKVIGAGFSRTATLSMFTAILDLGYKSYHGMELEGRTGLSDKWLKVLEHDIKYGNTKGIDWQAVMNGYDACFDAPAADYWLELIEAFPDAKIVYTHRPGDKWVESYRVAIQDTMTHNIWFKIAVNPWFPNQAKIVKVASLVEEKYNRDLGGLRPGLIEERLEAIRKVVPEDRLLVFHPSEGWEPLCKFLGVPVPDTPFPKINDGPSMATALNAVTIVGLALHGVALAVLAGAASWFYGRMH